MTVGERIKDVRKSAKMSQGTFGQKIGVSRDVIANLEADRTDNISHYVRSIHREFGVNEEWLLTGTGAKEPPATQEDALVKLADKILDDPGCAAEWQSLFATLAEMTTDELKALYSFAERWVEKKQ